MPALNGGNLRACIVRSRRQGTDRGGRPRPLAGTTQRLPRGSDLAAGVRVASPSGTGWRAISAVCHRAQTFARAQCAAQPRRASQTSRVECPPSTLHETNPMQDVLSRYDQCVHVYVRSLSSSALACRVPPQLSSSPPQRCDDARARESSRDAGADGAHREIFWIFRPARSPRPHTYAV
jgi:hypothetical protein